MQGPIMVLTLSSLLDLTAIVILSTAVSAFTTHSEVPVFRPSTSSSTRWTTTIAATHRPATMKLYAQKMTPTRKTRRDDSFEPDKKEDDSLNEDKFILDYSEAQSVMREEENRRRIEEGLTVGLTKEDEEEFNAKKDEYEDLRAKIRARASEEGFEKSLVTKEAIQEATRRAMAGQTSATPDQMLDLSGFGDQFEDGTEQLTPEEQAEIDKIASMPLWDQLKEEIENTRFPTPMAVFQTACLMALIFAVSATLILKGDAAIREIYTSWGLIPRPDEVYDFSDLELPDGFLEQQYLESDLGKAFEMAKDIANDIIPPSP